jgi:hypothetical protein
MSANVNAGQSTCPICHKTWLVTPNADCMLPSCGCYGKDTSASNPNRPCESCGTAHAFSGCVSRRRVRISEREVTL